jgi:hypothetical protein
VNHAHAKARSAASRGFVRATEVSAAAAESAAATSPASATSAPATAGAEPFVVVAVATIGTLEFVRRVKRMSAYEQPVRFASTSATSASPLNANPES